VCQRAFITLYRRAFAVAGPMTWNALLTQLRHPDVTTAAFGPFLKTVMSTDVLSTLDAFATKCYTNRHFTLHYRPRPNAQGQGRGQLVEAKVEAEAKILVSRPVWPQGLNITVPIQCGLQRIACHCILYKRTAYGKRDKIQNVA